MQDGAGPPGTDHQTGLPDGIGWNAVLEAEELRLRRYGGTHGLIRVRLLRIPDPVSAQHAAGAVAGAIRDIDLLARINEQTFAVLALHCEDLPAVVGRIHAAFEAAEVSHPDEPAPSARIDFRVAGRNLRAAWADLVAGAPPATAAPPGRLYLDFMVRPGFSLN